MNYYEELGLSPHASAEEIRNAYRALMRLLHPDHQSNPQLQHVAESQAKRLNLIYETLTDPYSRRQYDRDLTEGPERVAPIIIQAAPPRRGFFNPGSVAWMSAVILFAGLLIWMASRPTPTVATYTHDSGASLADPQAGARSTNSPEPLPQVPMPPRHEALNTAPQAAQSTAAATTSRKDASTAPSRNNPDADALRMRLSEALGEKEAALAELNRLQTRLQDKSKASERTASSASTSGRGPRLEPQKLEPQNFEQKLNLAKPNAEPLVTIAKSVPLPPPPPDIPIRNPIAGSWFYRKPATPPKNKDLYPPEFIETVIVEDNGQLKGTYHARYQVPNRPVSPDVSFQFAGKLNGDSGSLPWSGAGGSKGEVTFKLTADHTLRVDWTASQLGSLGFYRGTAVLVKKAD